MWKDSETELDFLDYDYLISVLKDTITDDKLLPASIGIYGDWGSGKSSLMYMCKKRLEQDDEKIKCLVFNGWLFESYDDAKSAILGSILDEISKQKRLSKKAQDVLKVLYKSVDKFKLIKKGIKSGADLLFTGGRGILSDMAIDSLVKKLPGKVDEIDISAVKGAIDDELNNKELREDIRKFQQEFEKLLEATKISRLVVFIDELDRCSPNTILDTLEAMKLFMFHGKVAFVIGADERHISYAVNSKYKEMEGSQISIGKEYLEKLIQYPIRIPKLLITG
jgi:predicted KAP-like P-loop ATPase